MIKSDVEQFKKFLNDSSEFSLIVHRDPDYDAISSAAALKIVLEQLGKKVKIYTPNFISEPLLTLCKITDYEVLTDEILTNGTKIVFLDGGERERFFFDHVKKDYAFIHGLKIDHHDTQEDFTDIKIVEGSASSTCEVLYLLFKSAGYQINGELARLLMIGILADTGWLKYQLERSETLRVFAELVEINNCVNELSYALTAECDIKFIPLWSRLLENSKFDEGTSLLYTFIDNAALKQFHLTEPELNTGYKQFLANVFRCFARRKVSMVLVEYTPGRWKGSLRSDGGEDTDLGKIADTFGIGGGHIQAAGFESELPVDQIIAQIIEKIKN